MKLNDLRKLAIKSQLPVRFHLSNGMECIVDQHGLAKIPELRSAPDFDLDVELAKVTEFLVGTEPRTRAQLEPSQAVAHAEEEE